MESRLEKTLRVEPFRLMHTGNFYEFFMNSWKEINPENVVYFGVSTRELPETNSSIYSYIHDEKDSIYAIHHNSIHQATAVYKKGYHSRLKMCNTEIMDKTLKEIIEIFNDKQLPFDYFGDQGLKSKAENVYRTAEIEALICYNPRDIEVYREILSKLRIQIPLYQEFENPEFTNIFNKYLTLIRDNTELDSEDFQIEFPDLFEELKQIPANLEGKVMKRIKGLKEGHRIINEIYKENSEIQMLEHAEEIKVLIRKKRALLRKIKEVSFQGKIAVPEEYEEKARILLSKITREDGIPRYLYVYS